VEGISRCCAQCMRNLCLLQFCELRLVNRRSAVKRLGRRECAFGGICLVLFTAWGIEWEFCVEYLFYIVEPWNGKGPWVLIWPMV
jgi:hypothetical protein